MKNTEWKKYLIELVVVFISITAAFILNSWRENSIEDELEYKYLNSLKNDVIQDSISLNTILSLSEKKLSKFKNYIIKNKEFELPIDTTLILIKEILNISRFAPQTNTYESMKYSGNLNLINSYDLREQITNYYESFGNIDFQQNLTLEFINNYVAKFVFENVNVLDFQIFKNIEISRNRINNYINTYSAFLEQNIRYQKEAISKNKKFLKIIRL